MFEDRVASILTRSAGAAALALTATVATGTAASAETSWSDGGFRYTEFTKADVVKLKQGIDASDFVVRAKPTGSGNSWDQAQLSYSPCTVPGAGGM